MKNIFIYVCLALLGISCSDIPKIYNDGFIQYEPTIISKADQAILKKNIAEMDKLYDPEGKMITQVLKGWNYHTDAESGTYELLFIMPWLY